MENIRVVWICHFSNKEIRNNLHLSKMRIYNFLRSIAGKHKKTIYFDFAPWITNLIKEFENFDNVELHIISPHMGMQKFTYEFNLRNINYHFFKAELPLIHKGFDYFFNNSAKYRQSRFFIKRFLKSINPDIINLFGTENPYYSISVLDIKKIPVYISVQTVYANPERKKFSGSLNKKKWNIEKLIHKKEKYFGCMGRMHHDLILNNNPNAIIFKMFFPIEKPQKVKELPKKFDFVFFAKSVVKNKGVEDIIEALAIVKKKKNDIKLNIVGYCDSDYKQFLLNKINQYNLGQNIIFNNYFPLHSDMHQHIVQSNFAVLPVKLDILPGAVIEAILLDLPLVTYKTSGTPYLNKDAESVLLADIDDIDMLAQQMIKLLESPNLGIQLKKNARKVIEKEFDNTLSAQRLLNNYYAVINHYHHSIPIPQEQLFDINEFPKY